MPRMRTSACVPSERRGVLLINPGGPGGAGVDMPQLLASELPKSVKRKYDLVGFDSIAAAQPKQYAEAMPGDDNAPGALARVMSRGLARLTAANKHTAAIFINQTRATIGVTFGPKSTTSGGKAMGFYASYRLSFVRTGKITEDVRAYASSKGLDAQAALAAGLAEKSAEFVGGGSELYR